MASPSLSAAAAAANPASPLTLDPTPLAYRSAAAATAAPRKRPVLLLDSRVHRSTPTSHLAPAAAAAAPLSQARRKRALSSSGRPRWQTALSIAAKNAALLAVLLYVGDLAWRSVYPAPPPTTDNATLAAAGYTERVAEFEASLKTAFRMLQVQLEVVDRKIESQVGTAREEFAALLEEKRLALEGQLSRLDARTNELNDAFGGFERMEFLRKKEFEAFWNEFKESLGSGGGTEIDLDQVRALAREIDRHERNREACRRWDRQGGLCFSFGWWKGCPSLGVVWRWQTWSSCFIAICRWRRWQTTATEGTSAELRGAWAVLSLEGEQWVRGDPADERDNP